MRQLLLASCLILRACAVAPAMAEDVGNNTVCFVPGPDDCALLAAAEIGKAKKTLDVQEFQLTEPHLAQAILDAKNRGVAVRLLLDKKAPGERNGQTPTLTAAGISCLGGFPADYRSQQGPHCGRRICDWGLVQYDQERRCKKLRRLGDSP